MLQSARYFSILAVVLAHLTKAAAFVTSSRCTHECRQNASAVRKGVVCGLSNSEASPTSTSTSREAPQQQDGEAPDLQLALREYSRDEGTNNFQSLCDVSEWVHL